jgi:gamma-glutamyl-gamma-aminobutyrate hydrolase PuuD
MNYVHDSEFCGNILSMESYQKLQLVSYKGKMCYYLPGKFKRGDFDEKLEEIKQIILSGGTKKDIMETFEFEEKRLNSLLIKRFKTSKIHAIYEMLK